MPRLARILVDGTAEEAQLDGDRLTTLRGGTVPISEAVFLTPSTPTKIVCVGFNYVDHAHELKVEIPSEPLFFLKPPSSLVPHRGQIVYPRETRQLEYEGELAVVIGRRCRNLSPEEAPSAILGYSILNDVTARDIQRVERQWVRAKCFDTFAPYGPVIATDLDPRDLRVVTRVNGEVRQDGSTRWMIFDVYALVAHASRIMTLEPGDVIATGTPPGVGPVQPGDRIEITIEGIGTLENVVVEEGQRGG